MTENRNSRAPWVVLALAVLGGLLGVGIWLLDIPVGAPVPAPAQQPQSTAEPNRPPQAAARQLAPELAAAAVPQLQPIAPAPLENPASPANPGGARRGGLRLSSAQLNELVNRANRPSSVIRLASQTAHPAVSDRPRLQHQLELVSQLDAALERRDPASMRELIARYRESDPHDASGTSQGYERLADCLEHPGDGSREAAQAYYDAQHPSRIRRAIERTCLASPP